MQLSPFGPIFASLGQVEASPSSRSGVHTFITCQETLFQQAAHETLLLLFLGGRPGLLGGLRGRDGGRRSRRTFQGRACGGWWWWCWWWGLAWRLGFAFESGLHHPFHPFFKAVLTKFSSSSSSSTATPSPPGPSAPGSCLRRLVASRSAR